MLIHFLRSNKWLAKRITSTGIIEPYPLVSSFTSEERDVANIQEFHNEVVKAAKLGWCLIKGELQKTLKKESRRGSTNPTAHTSWACFDIDGLDTTDLNKVLQALFDKQRPDYIIQWSNTMGIKDGLRCHIMCMLDRPFNPIDLKQWLMWQNLGTKNNPSPMQQTVKSMTSLNASHTHITYALDISVCQNDKLIYIADPKFEDLNDDPLQSKPRIQYIKGVKRTLHIDLPVGTIEDYKASARAETNQLRKLVGLDPLRKRNPKYMGTIEYNVGYSPIGKYEYKEERDFVYFNLSGGDSWGYYHPTNNPRIIFNFKGEPNYLTKEILPDYWDEVKEKQIVVANQRKEVEAINREQKRLVGEGTRLQQEEEAKGLAAPIREKGFAEAEAKEKLQSALNKFGDAAIRALVAEKIVEMQRDVGVEGAKALANSNMRVFAGSDGGKGFDMGKMIESIQISSSDTANSVLNKLARPNDLGFKELQGLVSQMEDGKKIPSESNTKPKTIKKK